MEKLISYISLAAPATRRPATGEELPFRVEIGFTPNWYRKKIGIDFGEKWHNDPKYRKESILAMREELDIRFPGYNIGRMSSKPDLLTGVYGSCTIAAIYGIPIIYSKDNWPNCAHRLMDDYEINVLTPPNLDNNHFFQNLINQLDWIQKDQGSIFGFINWQGVLNNAHRLRGEQIFVDMFMNPELLLHLMSCVCNTMIEAAQRIHQRQKISMVDYHFFTISNCLVNMISPEQYRDYVLPFDIKISKAFDSLGIHNCAWSADPYMEYYANISNLGYIDMGEKSDLAKAKKLFPNSRRAIMYTPMDLDIRTISRIEEDMKRIAISYAPCDIVVADIEEGTPDEKIIQFLDIVKKINLKITEGQSPC